MKYLLILALFLMGCEETKPQQPQVVEIVYRKDMQITHNGKTYNGIAVLPFQAQYSFTIRAYNKIAMLQTQSCHRDSDPFYSDKDTASLVYTPVAGLEDTGKCPLHLSAFATKDIFSEGMIVFQNPKYASKAVYNCCGFSTTYIGVGACQCKAFLRQRITFDCPTTHIPPVRAGCPLPTTEDNKSFLYNIGNGNCEYLFEEICVGQKRLHVLYTHGYDEVIIHK